MRKNKLDYLCFWQAFPALCRVYSIGQEPILEDNLNWASGLTLKHYTSLETRFDYQEHVEISIKTHVYIAVDFLFHLIRITVRSIDFHEGYMLNSLAINKNYSNNFCIGATFGMRTTLCEMHLLNDPDGNARQG